MEESVFNPIELFWTVFNFLLFFGVLAYFFFRPITRLLDARQQQIRADLEAARRDRDEAERLTGELRAQLADAQQRAQEIIDQARQLSEREREQRLAEAQAEADRLLERARATIATERDEAVLALRAELADLTALAAERVLRRALSGEEHRRLVEQAVDEVASVR